MKSFNKIDWKQVAEFMGAHLIKVEEKRAEVFHKNERYILWDNGGEINVTKVVDVLDYSVPYTEYSTNVDEKTLGYRLATAIAGDKIDYSFKV